MGKLYKAYLFWFHLEFKIDHVISHIYTCACTHTVNTQSTVYTSYLWEVSVNYLSTFTPIVCVVIFNEDALVILRREFERRMESQEQLTEEQRESKVHKNPARSSSEQTCWLKAVGLFNQQQGHIIYAPSSQLFPALLLWFKSIKKVCNFFGPLFISMVICVCG